MGKRLLVLLCLLICVVGVYGQTITGSVTGTVTDQTGATVPNATVTAVNVSTGVTTTTQTNDAGIYNLRFLPVAQYKLNVQGKGFSPRTIGPFALEVSQQATMDVKLGIEGTTESVEVTANAAPILNTENATTGESITAQTATEVPLNGRNFSSLTLLVAGAITPNVAAQNNVGRAAYNGGTFINGNREQTNNYLLDGADINESIDNYIGYSPNVDALAEVRVITGNATAEYGNANGGQMVMVTKSGTNQFHGNLFEFLENDKLNANKWSAGLVSPVAPKGKFDRNIFGGTFGGPIKKDKLFFFMDYQGARQHGSTSELRTVLPASYRQGIVPGFGTVPIVNPAAIFLFAHPEIYPLPNVTSSAPNGFSNNFAGSAGTFVQNDQADVKVDWKATDKDAFFGRFSIGRERSGNSKVSLPTDIPSNNNDPYTGFVTNWTRTISPTIVNEARAAFGRTRYTQRPDDLSGLFGLTGNQNLGIPGGQGVAGFSSISFLPAGFDVLGVPAGQQLGGIDSDSIVNTYEYTDNLTFQVGRHALKMGGQAIRYQQNRFYSGNDGALGQFLYDGTFSGNAYVDFLQDSVRTVARGATNGEWGHRQWRTALFLQDDFKFRPNLTINLGLRWEYNQPYYEVNNKQANLDINTGVETFAGQNGASRALYNAYWKEFMPRLGFSWSPTSLHDKVVIRGGYGITDFLEGTGANLRLTLNPPFFIDTTLNSTNGVPFHLTNGFPQPANTSVLSGNVRAWDPNLRPAMVQQFNLTTEYQLTPTLALTMAYLGQVGDHLVDPREGNQRPSPGAPLPLAATQPNIAVVSFTESEATMNYNALQLTGRKRVGSGLEFLANYTWSKSISNNLGYYGANGVASQSAYWQNAYDGKADNGPAFFDATHIVSVSGYYDLPFGHGRMFGGNVNGLMDGVLGGWKLGTVLSLHSGFPITISSPDASNTNARTARGNHYRPLNIVNQSAQNWFGTDPSAIPCQGPDNGVCAYGIELPDTFGTARVGSERAPGYQQVDFALSKEFPITEAKRFEFRADFFNAFNHASFAPPVADASSPSFGLISDTNSPPRNIQLALKFYF
jgi:hypothetical protein